MKHLSVKKLIIFLHLGVFGLASLVIMGLCLYRWHYQGKVYPGVSLTTQSLAGMNASQIVKLIERLNQRYQTEGLSFEIIDYANMQHQISLPLVMDGAPLVTLDSSAVSERALALGREGDIIDQLWRPLELVAFRPVRLDIPLRVKESEFRNALVATLSPFGESAQNASVKVTSIEPLQVTVVGEKTGRVFNFDSVAADSLRALRDGSFAPIVARAELFAPTITATEAQSLVPQVSGFLTGHTLALAATSSIDATWHTWTLRAADFAPWIMAVKDIDNGSLRLALDPVLVQDYLDKQVRPLVDRPPVDARFSLQDGKVTEFQGSQLGVALQAASTTAELNQAFAQLPFTNPPTTTVTVQTVAPTISVADLNELGLTEVVGVGISSFQGSHANRIKNIARAMTILNGILIKPGEEFSTLKALSPFTAENGYLPELVIKGDKIIPEIGGGMCQIGTTLFRLAMNTGLPITERRNHSLVVSYYSDPVNHNPGTDATIYDPTVDFKFLNDTGNYLLLQTEADYKKLQLTFTLWGKSDGRSGSYTHPVVSRWIPYGAPREVVAPTMAPGAKKCQEPFRGAVASFTYTRITPQGEKVEEVFTSQYRALPQICTVGPSATPATPTSCPEGADCPLPEIPTAETGPVEAVL